MGNNAPAETGAHGETKVLLVDDEGVVREVLQRALVQANYSCALARDGEEALAALRREEFDVLLTDLRMPGMDGIGLLKAIREEALDVVPVLFTGYGDVENAVAAMKLGAFDFLPKPVSLDTLTSTVARAARLRRHRKRITEERAQETQHLDRANADLERLSRLASGRELRMIELKRRINELAQQAGQTPPYDLSFVEGDDGKGGAGDGA